MNSPYAIALFALASSVACTPEYASSTTAPSSPSNHPRVFDPHDGAAIADWAAHDPEGLFAAEKAYFEPLHHLKLEGSLEVDGASVSLAGCANGQPEFFRGIDVRLSDGRKIRLAREVDGSTTVYYFVAAGAVATAQKACAQLQIEWTGVAYDKVDFVQGTARLACEAGAPKIVGSIAFQCWR